MDVNCVSHARTDCGEGPVWCAETKRLWWVDITGCRLHCYDPAAGSDSAWDMPEEIGAVVLRRKGGLLLTLQSGFAFFDPRNGRLDRLFDPHAADAATWMNDANCDREGRVWAGTYHIEMPRQPRGALFRLNPDLTCHQVASGFGCPNGPDWSPDSRTMYLGDSSIGRIYAFDFDLESGSISNQRIFSEIPPHLGRPDGLTVDAEGFIWCGHADGWQLTRFAPDGTIDQVLPMPVQVVTNCAFAGDDLDVMYITTARWGVPPEALARQPLAGNLFAARPGVRGLLPNRFAG